MGSVIYATGGDFLSEMITEAIKRRPMTGSTKKATENYQHAHFGFLEGMRTGLACYGNELRRKVWLEVCTDERERLIPAVSAYQFDKWISGLLEDWKNDVFKEMPDKDFFEIVQAGFLNIVFDDQFNELIEKMRRDGVKAGRLEPTEEDIAWLEEEYMLAASLAEPYKQILDRAKAQVKKE